MVLKYIGRFLSKILLGCNVLVALLMLLCAYSSYLNPVSYPILACAGLAFPVFLLLNLLFLLFWLVCYRRYALLSLVVMFACVYQIRAYVPVNLPTPKSEIPKDAIKILSYNVMAYNHDKPHKADSPNEIIEYLINCDADIVCTQEAVLNKGKNSKFLNEETVKKALSMYPYHSHVQENANAWDCFSRYPILSSKKIKYESVANGSVAYEVKLGADTLLLVNNHFESNKLTADDKTAYKAMIIDPKEENLKATSRLLIGKVADAVAIRAPQADCVAKYVRDSGHKYVVVCGDFNDSPISYVHRVMSEGLNDAFTDTGCGLGISYNRNGFYFRIDHILASDGLEIYNCRVDNRIKASDHYPISCYIRKR